MKKGLKTTPIVVAVVLVVAAVALFVFVAMRPQGVAPVTLPLEEREQPTELPTDSEISSWTTQGEKDERNQNHAE